MLGRRWLEVRDHIGSATASERIELQDNWVVTERISKGNKRCVTDVSDALDEFTSVYKVQLI